MAKKKAAKKAAPRKVTSARDRARNAVNALNAALNELSNGKVRVTAHVTNKLINQKEIDAWYAEDDCTYRRTGRPNPNPMPAHQYQHNVQVTITETL